MNVKRCTLCGGKLDHKRRCTFCGLDNTKNDEMYHRMVNRSECEGKPLTHVHTDKTQQAKIKPAQISKKSPPKERKRTGCVGSVIKVFLLLSLVSSLLSSVFSGVIQKGYDLVQEVFVGEITYDIVLESGVYEAGVHIPCAKYTMEYQSDSLGTVEISNFTEEYPETDMYFAASDLERERIELDAEDMITVPLDTYVRIYTREEVGETLTQKANPLKETVEVKWRAVAGSDFEPGVYDLVYEPSEEDAYESYESASVYAYIWSDALGVVVNQQSFFFDSYTGACKFKNLLLPEGSELVMDGSGKLLLTPSEWVSPNWETE